MRDSATLYHLLKNFFEVSEGWGAYSPNYQYKKKEIHWKLIGRKRFADLKNPKYAELSTWMRWNPLAKRKPTYEQFCIYYNLQPVSVVESEVSC